MPKAILWQAALLLPHPILTMLYLLAVRAERVEPSFVPVVALVVLPVLSTMVGVAHLRQAPTGSRGGQMVLLALAALEVSFTVLAAAVVGFAIGLQSL